MARAQLLLTIEPTFATETETFNGSPLHVYTDHTRPHTWKWQLLTSRILISFKSFRAAGRWQRQRAFRRGRSSAIPLLTYRPTAAGGSSNPTQTMLFCGATERTHWTYFRRPVAARVPDGMSSFPSTCSTASATTLALAACENR